MKELILKEGEVVELNVENVGALRQAYVLCLLSEEELTLRELHALYEEKHGPTLRAAVRRAADVLAEDKRIRCTAKRGDLQKRYSAVTGLVSKDMIEMVLECMPPTEVMTREEVSKAYMRKHGVTFEPLDLELVLIKACSHSRLAHFMIDATWVRV